jgi:cobalt-zinc-cadmium efflux system protein
VSGETDTPRDTWGTSDRRERRLAVVFGLNIFIVAGQAIGGVIAGSLGLLADAGHNLTDVAAIALSWWTVRLARRAPTQSRSFGWHRSTVLAAQANAAGILAVTLIIVYEAIRRLMHPESVQGGLVVVVALVALVANGWSALLLREPGHDLNMRSAFLHMAGDAAASAGVIVAGLVIFVTDGNYWLDPTVSIGIALLIAVQAVRLLRDSNDVLLESTPSDLDLAKLTTAIAADPGVEDVHDLHAWALSSDVRALSAHLVMTGHPTLEEAQVVGDRVRRLIASQFAIAHSTLELECEPCHDDDPCALDGVTPTPAHQGHAH